MAKTQAEGQSPVRILVVEDEFITATDIKDNLLRLGYEVAAVVDTGEDAVLKAAELRPDLILMDITLNGPMSGIEAATEIKHSLEIPIVYLTSHVDVVTIAEAKTSEPFGYLSKPYNVPTMLSTIEMALYKSCADNKRKRLEDQLQQAQKMEAVGRLAGGVAHYLNNMLSVIIGYADMMQEDAGPSDPRFADLKKIIGAAERSVDIVKQLLAFAREQSISPNDLNLNDFIADKLKMLRQMAGGDIELHWRPSATQGLLHMDPNQLDQILENLVSNARGAIDGKGAIAILTGNADFDQVYCESHAACLPGRYLRLSVSDDGCGMDEATLAQIFEPFFTTKSQGQGTGLGLATVYGIVMQNGGFIDVNTEPGRGTTCHIYLPCQQQEHGGPE